MVKAIKTFKPKSLKTFTKFIESEDAEDVKDQEDETEIEQHPLEESSLISKGYALGQGNRHETTKRQLESLASQIDSICDRAKREDELEDKINILLDAISKFAGALKLQAELSKNTINVSIATNLLEDDIKSLLRKK